MSIQSGELLGKSAKWRRLIYTNRIWFVAFVIIVAFGLYAGYLLFGSNSVEVLLRLRSQKAHLMQEAHSLETQNANLQKQIFELRGAKIEK